MGEFNEELHPRDRGKFTAGAASEAAHAATAAVGRVKGDYAKAAEGHTQAAAAHLLAAQSRTKAANEEKDPKARSEHAMAAITHAEAHGEHLRQSAKSEAKAAMHAVSSNPAAAFVAKHTEEAHAEPKAFPPPKGRGTPHVVEQHTAQGVVRHETNSKQEAHALGDKLSKQGHEVNVQPRDAAKAQAEKPTSAKFAAPSAPASPHQEDKPPPHTFGASPKEAAPSQHDKPAAAAFPAPKGEPSEHQKSGGGEKAFPAPQEHTEAKPATPEVTPEAKVAHVEDKFPYLKSNPPVHEAPEHAAPAEKHEGKPAEATPAEAKPVAAPKEKKAGKSKGSGGHASKEGGGHAAKGEHGGLGAWIQERAKGVAEGVKKLGEKANKFQEAAIKADPITMGFKAAGGAIGEANEAIEKAPVGHGM